MTGRDPETVVLHMHRASFDDDRPDDADLLGSLSCVGERSVTRYAIAHEIGHILN